MVLFCGTVQNAQDSGLVVKWDTVTVVHRSRSKSLFVIAHGKLLQSILLSFLYFCGPSCCALLSNDSIETLNGNILPTMCEFTPLGSDFGFGRTRSRFKSFWRLWRATIICNFFGACGVLQYYVNFFWRLRRATILRKMFWRLRRATRPTLHNIFCVCSGLLYHVIFYAACDGSLYHVFYGTCEGILSYVMLLSAWCDLAFYVMYSIT